MKLKKFFILVGVVMLLIGLYYFNIESKNQTMLEGVQNGGIIIKCDTDAKAYFYNEWLKTNKESDNYKTINLSYKNNYNKINNSCYVLVNYNFKTIVGSLNYLSITYSLVDIYKKDQYGKPITFGKFSQIVSNSDGSKDLLVHCNAFGDECTTVDEFLSIVYPYLIK